MKILAIDTSTQVLVMGVFQDQKVRALTHFTGQMEHAKNILPLLENLMQTAGLRMKDLDAVALGRGPGSFTGLRVGFAFVKGLCVVDRTPVALFSSMELLAWNCQEEHSRIAVVLDARREKFHFATFTKQDKIIVPEEPVTTLFLEEVRMKLQGAGETAVTGDALKRFHEPIVSSLADPSYAYPEEKWYASEEALEGLFRSKENLKFEPATDVLPEYLRLSEAEEKWNAK